MKTLRCMARMIGRALLGLVSLILVYALAAWLLPYFGSNRGHQEPATGEAIFIRSNGVHTDLILPIQSAEDDWATVLPFAHTRSGDSAFTHVAFGWGDKGFYLETKEWADLKVSTALKAAFGLSGSAMHVTYCDRPGVDAHCRTILVDAMTLDTLNALIMEGFTPAAGGGPRWIPGHQYEQHDAFYEGSGRYGLFFTCNTWANSVLKQAGLPAALWTATADGILRHYP